MRFHILVASVLAFSAVGCGKGYSSSKVKFQSSAVDLSSEEDDSKTPPVNNNNEQQFKSEELSQILSTAVGSLTQLITNLQGLGGGNFNFASPSVSINKTLPCATSGSVNVTATGTSSSNISVTEISANMSGGTGSATFTACTFPNPRGGTIKLDGTVTLNSLAGSFQINLGGSPYTFNSANQAAVVGTLQITTTDLTKSCDITSSQQSVLNGTINPANNFALSASATSTISASICGTSITL